MYQKPCGDFSPIDKYHVHELLDRLHIMQNMWEECIQNHPASIVFIEDKAEKVQDLIGALYQEIGRIEFEEFGG